MADTAPPTSAGLLRRLADEQARAALSADEQAAMQDRRAAQMSHIDAIVSVARDTGAGWRIRADHHRAMEQALLDGARALEAEPREV